MNKIFVSDLNSNNKKRKISPIPALKARGESEKDREIRIIEGLRSKKYSQEYIDKLSVLLYNSKNKINYSQKRNNIKKAIYKLDDNNELYLTLPKLRKNKNVGVNALAKTETTEYSNNKNTTKPSPKRNFDDDDDILDENIREILYENENNNTDKEEEQKGKILFDKLKTRYDNFNFDNSIKKSKFKSLPKLKKKQIPSEYKLIATPQQISEFDYNLGKSFVNGHLRYLTKFQKEKLGYIAQLNIFNSIDRLKEKTNIIKEIKNNSKSKKRILMPIDFFKYDSEKWKKISEERNQNYNDIIINKLNDDNKDKINDMKEYLNKLNIDAFAADKDVNKAINNINNFLSKYGMDNLSSNSSKRNFKHHSSSKKKEKKQSEEKTILNLE